MAAPRFIVSTRHTKELVSAVVSFRTALLSPSQGLQRVLVAACCVAVGLLFVAGPVRYACWAGAAVVLLWAATSRLRAVALQRRRDPYLRSGRPEVLAFTRRALQRLGQDADGDTAPGPEIPYTQITGLFRDDQLLYLCTRAGEIIAVDRHAVDGGEPGLRRLEQLLRDGTGRDLQEADRSVRSRMRATQQGRRRYVKAHPAIADRVAASLSRKPAADGGSQDEASDPSRGRRRGGRSGHGRGRS